MGPPEQSKRQPGLTGLKPVVSPATRAGGTSQPRLFRTAPLRVRNSQHLIVQSLSVLRIFGSDNCGRSSSLPYYSLLQCLGENSTTFISPAPRKKSKGHVKAQARLCHTDLTAIFCGRQRKHLDEATVERRTASYVCESIRGQLVNA
jgi:hypothetical protein